MKKKNFLLILTLFGSVIVSNAQAFEKNTSVAGVGLEMRSSLRSIFNHSDNSGTPVLNLQYERGMWNIGGPGVISLGAYAAFSRYESSGKTQTAKWNCSIIGLRGAYHFAGIKNDNIDLYGGLMLSYKFYDQPGNSAAYNAGNIGSAIHLTPYAGCRYLFAGRVGFFAELSCRVSHATVGIAIKY